MIEPHGVTMRIMLAGDFDITETARLQQILHRAVDAETVIIDMSGMTYIDSSALSCLVSFYKSMKRHDGRVFLTGVPSRVRRILEVSDLSSIFPELG